MGGIKSDECNKIACDIWEFCIREKLWVSAAHIPGRQNQEADAQSRILEDATEWKLNPELFQKIVEEFGEPEIDLFASRINRQSDRYVSWFPEPEATAVDAFSLVWSNSYFYMFPPFSLIGKVLAKASRDKTKGIIVVPDWPTQHWYPRLLQMTRHRPMTFRPSAKNLMLMHKPTEVHSLHKKLQLMAVKVIPQLTKFYKHH